MCSRMGGTGAGQAGQLQLVRQAVRTLLLQQLLLLLGFLSSALCSMLCYRRHLQDSAAGGSRDKQGLSASQALMPVEPGTHSVGVWVSSHTNEPPLLVGRRVTRQARHQCVAVTAHTV